VFLRPSVCQSACLLTCVPAPTDEGPWVLCSVVLLGVRPCFAVAAWGSVSPCAIVISPRDELCWSGGHPRPRQSVSYFEFHALPVLMCVQVVNFLSNSCVHHCRWNLGIALESLDVKTRGFVVRITLQRWFSEHAHQIFGEMSMRT
jgi:hypothetical protein